MVKEHSFNQIKLALQVNGKWTSNMAMALRLGLTKAHIKVCFSTEKSMDKEISSGQINLSTQANALKTKFMVKVRISGLMDECMMASGEIIK